MRLISNGKETNITSRTTKLFYYGPRSDSATVEGALFFSLAWNGEDDLNLCGKLVNRDNDVEGKLFVSDIPITYGTGRHNYAKISRRKAGAYVFADPYGIVTFYHTAWDVWKYSGRGNTPVFALNDAWPGLLYEFAHLAENTNASVSMRIEPPHSTLMQHFWMSSQWLILFRILFPLLFLAVAYLTGSECFHIENDKSPIRTLICAIESVTCVLCGLWLTLGAFGPTALPGHVVAGTVTFFSGLAVLPSVILALFLYEENARLKLMGRKKVDIRKKYPLTLLCVTLFFVLCDTLDPSQARSKNGWCNGKSSTSTRFYPMSAWLVNVLILSPPILSFFMVLYFLCQVYRQRDLLNLYVKYAFPRRSSRQKGRLRIGRFIFWLTIASTFILLDNLINLYLYTWTYLAWEGMEAQTYWLVIYCVVRLSATMSKVALLFQTCQLWHPSLDFAPIVAGY